MIYISSCLLLSLLIMMTGLILSKKSFFDKEKTSPFECGFDPYYMSRNPFSMRFFKIAIIFLIFDVEIAIIIPLPILMNFMTNFFLMTSTLVIMIILFGLLFEWQQGSIEWMK